MPEKKLFLIDAHALCYRSYFAIRNLSTSRGQATNAVFGFLSTLKKILRDHHPEYLGVCFDSPKKTRRQEKFAQYKIQRPAMPEDLVSQIPIIKEVVAAYRLPVFECEGFEADDIIATLTKKLESDVEVVIVSDDKDMLQLLNERVKVYSARKDEMLGPGEAKEQWGVDPRFITDFIALAGDQSDNIPGVVGVGEVTARQLINEFGPLENILANLDRIKKDKLREMLSEQKKMAVFSKELAVLDTRVPLNDDLETFRVGNPDEERLRALFHELEFKKFVEELPKSTAPAKKIPVRSVSTKEDAQKLISRIGKTGKVALLIDFQQEPTLAAESPVLSLGEEGLFSLSEDALKELAPVFSDGKIEKITFEVKEVFRFLGERGIGLRGKLFDVRLAGYLLSPAQASFSFTDLAWNHLKESIDESEPLARKADLLWRLYPLLAAELAAKELEKLFTDIEIPLAEVIYKMEREGVALDLKLLLELSKETDVKLKKLMESLYKSAGHEFNLNSPKQLSQVLFEELKLPVVKKTKTGFSTDEEVLSRLAASHELPAQILEYRQLTKLKNTYIDALPKLVDSATGRLHARFHQTGAETGRLSSSDPNLQNIPVRTELGRQIRRAFIPFAKDHLLLSADYSQIELRILAHLSGDQGLKKAFEKDQDIHAYTAAQVFEVNEQDVTSHMRNTAKRVNFGIIYGMSAFGLAKDLGIPQGEAQAFIDRYFLRYPDVKKFMENTIKKAEERGFVVTLLNRRRYLPDIKSPNMSLRQFAQRQAINTPVQGTAADLIKLAMINIQNELEQRKLASKMIITVHDELVFDVPQKEQAAAVELVRGRMEDAIKLSVPVKVAVKAGPNWLDMKEL